MFPPGGQIWVQGCLQQCFTSAARSPLHATLEELVRIRSARFIGEVVYLVVPLVILFQQPLHLGPRVTVDVLCDDGVYQIDETISQKKNIIAADTQIHF